MKRNTKHTPTFQAKHIHTHTDTHMPPIMHQLVKIHVRHTLNNGEDKGTALARSVVVTYYWGLKPVCVSTTSLLAPIPTLLDIQCT